MKIKSTPIQIMRSGKSLSKVIISVPLSTLITAIIMSTAAVAKHIVIIVIFIFLLFSRSYCYTV